MFHILEYLNYEVISIPGCSRSDYQNAIEKAEVKFAEPERLSQRSEMSVTSLVDAFLSLFLKKFVKCKSKDINLDSYEILPIENLFIKKGPVNCPCNHRDIVFCFFLLELFK